MSEISEDINKAPTPSTDEVWSRCKFDQHIQAINAANSLVKRSRRLEREKSALEQTIAQLRDSLNVMQAERKESQEIMGEMKETVAQLRQEVRAAHMQIDLDVPQLNIQIKQLRQEIETRGEQLVEDSLIKADLRQQFVEAKARVKECVTSLITQLAEAQQQRDAAVADKERLDWLEEKFLRVDEDSCRSSVHVGLLGVTFEAGATLRAAIDAARSQAKEEK